MKLERKRIMAVFLFLLLMIVFIARIHPFLAINGGMALVNTHPII